MSDQSTVRMIDLYMEEASAPMFLSGFFQSPPRNFHTSEKVEIDIIRDEEDVAIVITDLSTGSHLNESNLYQNKGFTPPIYSEMGAINAYKQLQRHAGHTPFEDPDYGANAMEEAFGIGRKLERKIRRAVELMASQVLQTGALTLINGSGVAVYTLDFGMKNTHLVNAAATWAPDGSTGSPLVDLEALARVVRRDGKKSPNRLIFGGTAFQCFLANADVQKQLQSIGGLGPAVGQITPQARGEGATFQGYIWIGNYRFEMWTYDGFFKHPQTGVLTDYVSADNVIMLSDQSRLDLTYGAIPLLKRPDAAALAFMPPRMSSGERGLDLTMNAWFMPDGSNLMVSAGTRPLTIPTAIDTYAVLDRQQA